MQESTKLPNEFSDLQSLADRFAVSDDLKRQQVTDTASAEDLRQLVDTMWPRFGAINAYLDQHDDEPACVLGCLAEAASEVANEIGPPA
jgi:hypothetical protein